MKNLARILAVSCVAAAMHSQADGLDDFITSLDEVATDAEDATGSLSSLDDRKEEKPSGKADQSKPFYLMPFCRNLEGKAEVMIPGKAWEPIQEGKYYPLGTRYRTIGASSRLKIIFGFESEVSIVGEATFGTIAMPAGEKSRAITLVSGVINVKVPNNLSEGLFSVNAPGFVVCNLAGESSYTYNKVGDGDEAIVNCVTKSLSVKGRNFEIPSMRAANKVRIVTSQDNLVTAIYGMSGDIMTKLDQGRILVKDYGTGKSNEEDKFLDWKLAPNSSVRIHRAVPALGEAMAVTVMTFDDRRNLKNRCAFAEKVVQVNSGELGPASKKDREELAKRAADMTDTGDAVATDEDVPVEEEVAADPE